MMLLIRDSRLKRSFTQDYFYVLIQGVNSVGRGASISEAPVEVLPYNFSQGGSTGEGDASYSTFPS
jgi:hypothetical protein